jgi:ribonuclease HI
MTSQGFTYTLATDGACDTNHIKVAIRTAGWGFVAVRSDGRKVERNGFCLGAGESNQTGELEAVIQGLSLLKPGSVVEVLTDSTYVINGATQWLAGWKAKGWKKADNKPVQHRERWETLDHLMNTRQVTFKKVKGHSGHPLNERADRLAVDGMKRCGP